jgi:RimJ/RimL family protein N-acetyltransferase
MAVPPPTERLTFREMHDADLDLMAGLLGDARVLWVYPRPWTRDEVARWIRRAESEYRERGFGLWIIEERETGAFVGECGLTQQVFAGTVEVEVGYQLRPESWGRGLATEAASACIDFARDVAGLARVVALIDPRNDASKRVAAKIGLRWERDVEVPGKTLGVYAIDFGRAGGAADAR